MAAEYEWPAGVFQERQDTVARILWILHEEGPIESDAGTATGILLEHLSKRGLEMSGGYLNKTLSELEPGGRFGHLVTRDIQGKRTYSIALAVDPDEDPFPPNPFGDVQSRPKAFVSPTARAPEPELPLETTAAVEVVDADLDDDLDHDHAAESPSTALALMPEPAVTDKILYIQSMLNEIIGDLVAQTHRDFDEQLNARLSSVNHVLEENARLKKENEDLRAGKQTLARALEQSNQILRNRNGQPAAVHT